MVHFLPPRRTSYLRVSPYPGRVPTCRVTTDRPDPGLKSTRTSIRVFKEEFGNRMDPGLVVRSQSIQRFLCRDTLCLPIHSVGRRGPREGVLGDEYGERRWGWVSRRSSLSYPSGASRILDRHPSHHQVKVFSRFPTLLGRRSLSLRTQCTLSTRTGGLCFTGGVCDRTIKFSGIYRKRYTIRQNSQNAHSCLH